MKTNFATWAKSHKPELGVGAVGVVVSIALYVRSKNSASSGSSTSSTTPTVTVPAATDVGGGYGGDGLSSILEQIQTELAGATPSTSSTPTVPIGQVLNGSGYSNTKGGDVESSSGGYYAAVANWSDAQALMGGGTTLDYESAPGIFSPRPASGGLAPTTTLYEQVPTPSKS